VTRGRSAHPAGVDTVVTWFMRPLNSVVLSSIFGVLNGCR
jgi:hypothetical protein